MSFDIPIKVDATQAKPAIESIRASLAKIEDGGKNAGTAVSGGMRQGGLAAEKAKEQAKGFNDGMGELKRSGIELEGSFREVTGRLGGMGGEVGTIFDTATGKGALAIGAFIGVAAEVGKLSDEWDQLANRARVLQSSTESLAGTMQRQLDLAGDLHGSLESTVMLSVLVKEHTDSLNLSTQQQTDLTKELGEVAKLSGKSFEEIGEAFGRVAFDFEEGLPPGRDMKSLLREFPPLAEALGHHFGVSGQQIMKMANDGRISFAQFKEAIVASSDEIGEKFAHRTTGMGEDWQHFKDVLSAPVINPITEAIERGQRELEKFVDAAKQGTQQWAMQYDYVSKIERALTGAGGGLTTMLGEMAKHLKDPWGDAATAKPTGLSNEQKLLQEITRPMDEVMRKQHDLADLYDKGRISLDLYTVANERLLQEEEKLIKTESDLQAASAMRSYQLPGLGSVTGGAAAGGTDLSAGGLNTAGVNAQLASMLGRQDPKILTDKWKAAIHDYEEEVKSTAKVMLQFFKPVEEQLINFMHTGNFEWRKMIDSMLTMLEQLLIKLAEIKIIEYATGVNINSGVGGVGKLLGLYRGGDVELLHAASGLTGIVGGTGGTDSQIVPIAMTPGETVMVRTPEQMTAARQGSGAPTVLRPQVHIHVADRRGLLDELDTPDGHAVVARVNRKLR